MATVPRTNQTTLEVSASSHRRLPVSDRPPAFSVIIPTHNRCGLVVRAVESVLEDALSGEVEVVVVDDASTDATTKILRERYRHDTRVRLLYSKINEGPSGARNRGLAIAEGDFVIFLDSDDRLLPHALAFAQAAFEQVPKMQFLSLEGEAASIDLQLFRQRIVRGGNPGWRREGFNADLFQHQVIEPSINIDKPPQMLEFGDLFPAVLFGDLFFLSGLVIRRHAALAAGPFNLKYRYFEDWDFAARLCLTGIGGYLAYVGFHREIGRKDQLGRVGTPLLRAVMHQHVLANVAATGRIDSKASLRLLRRAQAAADYCLGHRLLERHHQRSAQVYLMRSLRQAYKPFKTLVWLAGGEPLLDVSRYLSGRRLLH